MRRKVFHALAGIDTACVSAGRIDAGPDLSLLECPQGKWVKEPIV